MPERYDVIIVGLGAMGSALICQLAGRPRKVLGLDRFQPPHAMGSSHGQTRIIREAYFEDPVYVPLVQRAYELWAQLEERSGRRLLQITGGVMIGPADGILVAGALRSATLHHLPHERLTGSEVSGRFPGLRPGEDKVGVWEPRAGILFPEEAIAAQLGLAGQAGATVRGDEAVTRWHAGGNAVAVETNRGSYEAGQLVFTAGPWIGSLVPELGKSWQIERQVQFWFTPNVPGQFTPDRCPIHLWEYEQGRFFYGFPDVGQGVKLAIHHEGELTSVERVRREVSPVEIEQMRGLADRYIPGAAGALRHTAVCLYTNTDDGHFWIDQHPGHSNVWVVSSCSGHGFKFAPAIGEIVSEWMDGGRSRFDLSLFRTRPGPG